VNPPASLRPKNQGSVLIIVLWIAFGLVGLALYFGYSMNFELRASENRVASQAADQAIDGAARYITYILTNQISGGSNGMLLDRSAYKSEAVPVGDAHFWIIGRDTNNPSGPGRMTFGLIDEASKLNLNTLISNQVIWLPRMTVDFTMGILDWRDTNGNGPTTMYYTMMQPPYLCKNDPFETVDELRLVYGAGMDILVGEDFNRNGVLDPNETDENMNNMLDPGVLEYVTAYSREPNNGTINVTNLTANESALSSLLSTNFSASRVTEIMSNLGLGAAAAGAGRSAATGAGSAAGARTTTTGRTGGTTSGGTRGGGRTTLATPTAATATPAAPAVTVVTAAVRFPSILAFYAASQMTPDEFALVATNFTVWDPTNSVIEGRVNVNTASLAVLTCLLASDTSAAQQLVNYRLANPNNLSSVAWVKDALGSNFPDALTAIAAGDYITTQTYQYTADIAALGPNGRGYRRVKFIFDTSTGTPQIIYRQDLTHLGWALGAEARQRWVLAKATK